MQIYNFFLKFANDFFRIFLRMTTQNRYKYASHCVYNMGFHIIFCPKYRRKVLVDGIDERLEELLLEKAEDLEIQIDQMEVTPDHVHLFVKCKPTLAVHHIINQLKGYTSVILRREFPKLKSRLPTLWTRSYYVESVGHISEEAIRKYIEDQKKV